MLQMKKLLFGLLGAVLLSVVLLSATALVILKTGSLPEGAAGTAALVVGCLSVFPAALWTARLAGEKGMLHGVALAAMYLFLYLAVSLAFYTEANIVAIGIRAAAFLLSGALGGMIGVGMKRKIRF